VPSPAEPQSPLLQRYPPALPDDHVIQHVNVQQLAGLEDGARHGHVVGAGRRIAAGVVVDHDDGRGVAPDSRFEHLADVHL